MNGPFFMTHLETDVRIAPYQMNNNIIDNVKKNIENKYVGKCYSKYGYIDKIYEIDNVRGGIIRAEDVSSSAIYRAKFKCRLCNPVKNSLIMGTIHGINSMMIIAVNGPIVFLIVPSQINTDNIKFRKSAYYPVNKKGEIIDNPIVKGTNVMIRVNAKKISHGSDKISVIGRMEYVAENTDVEKDIMNKYDETNIVDEQIITEDILEN
jgi:DNA-directed RNA polymerase subunit E'/Rpb7